MSIFLDNLSFLTFCKTDIKNTFYLSLSFYFRFFGNPRKMRVSLNGTEGHRRNKIQVLFYFIADLKFFCIPKLNRRSKIQNSIDLDPTQKRLFLLNLMIKATNWIFARYCRFDSSSAWFIDTSKMTNPIKPDIQMRNELFCL